MKNGSLFSSTTDPIPEIRRELNVIPIEDDGRSLLYFHDPFGYANSNFALDRDVESLLTLIDGSRTIDDLTPYLGEDLNTEHLLKYIRFLDENRLLNSTYFKSYSTAMEEEYEATEVHHPVAAGESYPRESEKLARFLLDAFERAGNGQPVDDSKALYAPHIDPRVGLESYAKAFSAIQNVQPKRVFILATSHYGGLYADHYENKPFVATRKKFEFPHRNFQSDLRMLEQLEQQQEELGISFNDRAHRLEHSVEMHLLFLGHIWRHNFQVVPILVNSFNELFYSSDGKLAQKIDRFSEFLHRYVHDDESFFLISGDLSHIGKKFGDERSAQDMLDTVKAFDADFMQYACLSDESKMLELLQSGYDPYRICGFPPLYTFLKTANGSLTGKPISYDLWDEAERESAVTFGSIIYSK